MMLCLIERALNRIFLSFSAISGSWPIQRSRIDVAAVRISSTGRATSRLMASIDCAGCGPLLGGEQIQRVQGDGDFPAKDFGELHVQLGEGAHLRDSRR